MASCSRKRLRCVCCAAIRCLWKPCFKHQNISFHFTKIRSAKQPHYTRERLILLYRFKDGLQINYKDTKRLVHHDIITVAQTAKSSVLSIYPTNYGSNKLIQPLQRQEMKDSYNFCFWLLHVSLGVLLCNNLLQLLFIPVHHRVCISSRQSA